MDSVHVELEDCSLLSLEDEVGADPLVRLGQGGEVILDLVVDG